LLFAAEYGGAEKGNVRTTLTMLPVLEHKALS